MNSGRAVIILSGGLDSTVALAMVMKTHDVRLVVFFDYGQRALPGERAAAIAVATYYELPFREIDISWLENLAPDGMRGSVQHSDRDSLQTLDDVWIPNRNGVFLNVGAAFAEKYDCGTLVTGFNREEAAEFPDNSARYVDFVNEGLSLSTRNGVKVVSPTLELDKREILAAGHTAKAPLSVIWSCYRAGARMCGRCASCQRLQAALARTHPDIRPVIEFQS